MTYKLNNMNNILRISFVAIVTVTFIGCGTSAKDKKGEIGD